MVSTYEYTNLAGVEVEGKRDYSAIDAVHFSTENMDLTITNAEVMVNSFVGTIFTDTIPPAVKLATEKIVVIMCNIFLVEHNVGKVKDVRPSADIEAKENKDIMALLLPFKDLYSTEQSIFISKRANKPAQSTYSGPLAWR